MTTCQRCGAPMTLTLADHTWRCPNGHRRPETLDEAQARLKAQGERPPLSLNYRGKLPERVLSLYESGQDALWRGDTDTARRYLQQSVDMQPDFADGHVALAKIAADPAAMRDHLEQALAHDPGHQEALRLMLVLQGRLTPEQAERAARRDTPEQKRVEGAVKAQAVALKCPICGGTLTTDETNRRVVCPFCGHTAVLAAQVGEQDLLGAALLERKAQLVEWIVGERLLHCNGCGAERTLGGRMGGTCPFCGSAQVIEQDALGTLERPSMLLPFRLSEEAAKAALRERLRRMDEKLLGIVSQNRVVRAVIEPLYIPFWVFDAQLEVQQTRIDRRTPRSRNEAQTIKRYETTQMPDGLLDLPVPAVDSPAPDLLNQLGTWDWGARTPYDPKLLAKIPAALYTRRAADASLMARSLATTIMRGRYGKETGEVTITVYVHVQQMTYGLALLPVWVAALTEQDGDLRSALINGQTGAVALGKAMKPKPPLTNR